MGPATSLRYRKNREAGQAMAILFVAMAFMSLLSLYTIRSSESLAIRAQTQMATDLTSLSISRSQARDLNGIAFLNKKLSWVTGIARVTLAGLAGISICAGIPPTAVVCKPILTATRPIARKLLLLLKKVAEGIRQAQKAVKMKSKYSSVLTGFLVGREN